MRKNLNIIIRTDGGNEQNLGFGHIYRSVSFLEDIKKSLNVNKYIFVVDRVEAEEFLKKQGIAVIRKPKGEDEIKFLNKLMKKLNADFLLIDLYDYEERFSEILMEDIFVIGITDLKNLYFPAHIMVNGFIGHENKVIRGRGGTFKLIGPQYYIINYKIRQNKKILTNEQNKTKKDVFLFFGGVDLNNVSNRIAEILKEIYLKDNKLRDYNFKFIKGLNSKIMIHSPYNFTFKNPTKNYIKELINTKFAIISAGNISYELAYLGVPVIFICQVEHQLLTAYSFEKRGFGRNLGLWSENNLKEKLTESLNDYITNKRLLRKMSILGEKLVDGKATERIINLLKNEFL